MKKRIYNRVWKSKPVPQTTEIKCVFCGKNLKDFEIVMQQTEIILNVQLCATCKLKDKSK